MTHFYDVELAVSDVKDETEFEQYDITKQFHSGRRIASDDALTVSVQYDYLKMTS